ncbi:MAG: methyl-accepting chemotaxis protein [Cryomorphaceae bacterium]|jgi:methyl-accepting chemotaxis protein
MSDPKQNADDGISTEIGPVSASAGSERLWLTLTLVAFILALLASLVLPQVVSVQQQRADHAEEIVDKVNLTTSSAAQALSASGQFEPFEKNMIELEAAVDQLVQLNSTIENVTASLFGNAAGNQSVSELFLSYQGSLQAFQSNKGEVTQIKNMLSVLSTNISSTVNDSVGFVEAVAKEGRNKGTSSSKNKYLFLTSEASNLNGILGRLAGTMGDYFDPDSNLSQISNRQSGFMVRLQDTLNRIVSNSAAVVGTAAEPLQTQYLDLEAQVSEVGDRARFVSSSRTTLATLRQQGAELSEAVQSAGNQGSLVNNMSRLATLLPILLAVFGAFALWRYTNIQNRDLVEHDADLEETLADQQESILKLLDEMSALADGDLTVEAEVTDQITGAIADSVNFAVMEMRELVSQINRASIEVANESELAVNNAQSVSKSNMTQAAQISSAATLMQSVSSSMREMSEQASSSATMAAESIQAASRGTQAVRDTITGMDDMREQIQETSKRIKRLGESSQRIGDIVALIDDIAEQTNILSLNAAIQASMAGEAGRGFAVVSDEVQSLAERSTEATKKIAELVTTIQNDTNDAVLSMEKATQQVVAGTKIADSAGTALSEIENVSQRLSGLIDGISKESNQQAEVVYKVSEEVTQVSDSSTDTSRKAQDSANSIAKLLELAKDLETSVSRFKLPSN